MRTALIVAAVMVAGIGTVALLPDPPRKSYLDIAHEYQADCVKHVGYGEWADQVSGMQTLDQYCEVRSMLKAHREMREAYPNG